MEFHTTHIGRILLGVKERMTCMDGNIENINHTMGGYTVMELSEYVNECVRSKEG